MKLSRMWLFCAALALAVCGKQTLSLAGDGDGAPAGGQSAGATAGRARIVSTVPAATLNLLLIGGDKQLVGVSSFDKAVLGGRMGNLPVVGDYEQTNYEQIVKLAPTVLIIQSRDVAPRMQEFVDEHHIQLLNMKFDHVDDIWSSVRVLAKASGREDAAEKAIAAAKKEISDVAVDYKDAPRPSVIYLMDPPSNLACGNNTFVEEMMNLAGGRLAPVGNGFATVNRETMIKLAPDVLLIGAPDGQPEVGHDPRLAPWMNLPVPAARDHRVFLVTNPESQIPSLNIGKNVRELAEILHRNQPNATTPAGAGAGRPDGGVTSFGLVVAIVAGLPALMIAIYVWRRKTR